MSPSTAPIQARPVSLGSPHHRTQNGLTNGAAVQTPDRSVLLPPPLQTPNADDYVSLVKEYGVTVGMFPFSRSSSVPILMM